MLIYFLAVIGALTVTAVCLILILIVFGWLNQPVNYLVGPDEIQRYLRSWGSAIADGGRILVRQPGMDPSISFVRRRKKRSGEHLVFRFRNADAGREHFHAVESALTRAGIGFDMERTPTGRPRAIVIPFSFGNDPLTLTAAAHATRVALCAMGTPEDGPFEMICSATRRPDYEGGSADVIPWTRAHRLGFVLGQAFRRLMGRT